MSQTVTFSGPQNLSPLTLAVTFNDTAVSGSPFAVTQTSPGRYSATTPGLTGIHVVELRLNGVRVGSGWVDFRDATGAYEVVDTQPPSSGSVTKPGRWGFATTGDFAVADGLEEITFKRLNAAGGIATTLNGLGLREVPRRKVVALGGETIDLIWHLDAGSLAGISRISYGDIITGEDDSEWVVATADLAGALDQWTCQTIRKVS